MRGVAFLLGTVGACIDPGPLFPEEGIRADAGSAIPSGLGGAGGTSSTPPPGGDAGDDIGSTPTNEGPPMLEGPIDAPPRCEAVDAGVASSCGEIPAGVDPPGEDPSGEDPPGEDPSDEGPPEPQDACNDCLAGECPQTIERCDDTNGCAAIVSCARESGCEQDACYCGNVNVFVCTTTAQADGPCRDVMLAAPGAHTPNFVEPNAGPAALAASEVGQCRAQSDDCRSVCDD